MRTLLLLLRRRRSSRGTRRGFLALGAASIAAAAVFPAGAAATTTAAEAGTLVSVIVRELPRAGTGPEGAVGRLGGEVRRQIGIIDGFSARVPPAALARLRALPGVHSVTRDGRVVS